MIFKGKTVLFDNPPVITASAGVGGKKEGEGPLAAAVLAMAEEKIAELQQGV